ncbi:MAG: hypothetical protein ACXWBL_07430 [Usitatibacter sp.]
MKRTLLAAALAAASLAVFPQPSGPGPVSGPGMGPGSGPGMGMRFNDQTTPGWSMMSPEERKAHQDKMRAMMDRGECEAYMTEHHKQMEARAKENGKALPGKGPGPGCDHLKKKS